MIRANYKQTQVADRSDPDRSVKVSDHYDRQNAMTPDKRRIQAYAWYA